MSCLPKCNLCSYLLCFYRREGGECTNPYAKYEATLGNPEQLEKPYTKEDDGI